MPNIPQIISQPNLLRNGDFSHYVNSTTSPSPPGDVFPSLLAHWNYTGGGAFGITISPSAVVVPDDPHRYVLLDPGETLEQLVLDHSFFRKPSVREFDGTISGAAAGGFAITTASAAFEVTEHTTQPIVAAAEIDLAGLLAGEDVTFDFGGAAGFGPIVLTEGVDFTDAATLAAAINSHGTLGPLLQASAVGTVTQVLTDDPYNTDADALAALGTLAETVTGATWVELNGGLATTQFRKIPKFVRTQPGDEVQLVNFTNPGSSGRYRVSAYNSSTSVDLVPVAPTDASTAVVGDTIRILRSLPVFLVDLTTVFSVPVGQAASDIEPSLIIKRELPMPDITVTPLTSLVAGAPTAYDEVTLSPGAAAKQIVCRLTAAEFIRSPRDLVFRLENTAGGVAVADVGLYVGNYHLPVSTVIPAPRGSVATPLIPGPDHLHLLTGKGDLILMRAGSQAPAGYKKLKEELAFQIASTSITYDAASDTSTVSVLGWAVPADELSGTYEIVFTDTSPAPPAKPGPLDVSVRMSDITFNLVGGARIDLAGLLAGEDVTFDVGGAAGYGPITLTEGVDFGAGIPLATTTAAESLAIAINGNATLDPLMTASASGTIVTVIDDGGYTTDPDLLANLGTLAETVTGATWTELDGVTATTQFRTIKSAEFTVDGDLGPRHATPVYVVATAPIQAGPESVTGDFRKPTKTGDGAVEISTTVLEIDVDGVSVNDILTFVDEDGNPLPPEPGPQGPTYRIISVNLNEGQVTVTDVTGGTTDVGPYTTDPANSYVIEKASGNHTHYAQQSNIDERDVDDGGSNSNTARGQHGHQMYADDAIPPYRKFIICEKL